MVQNEPKIPIIIDRTPKFTETWYEGYVEYQGKKHMFWLIDPIGSDYEMEVRWFFKTVPREIRAIQHTIIEAFKQDKYGSTKEEETY